MKGWLEEEWKSMHNRSAEHAMMTLPTGKHTIQYVEKNVSNNKNICVG